VLAIVFGSMGFAVNAFADGSNEVAARLLVDKESHRARKRLVEELKTSDSVSLDERGEPYMRVESIDGGTDNSIVFRNVVGYDIVAGEDTVSTVYGSEVRYFVDSADRLVRAQDGQETVVATRVVAARFTVSPRGVITIGLDFEASEGSSHYKNSHQIRIVPKNIRSI